jgi:hypothetical protein
VEVAAPDEVVELLLHDGVDEWACELCMWRSVWLRLLEENMTVPMPDTLPPPPSTSRRENLSYLIHNHHECARRQLPRPLGPVVRPQVRCPALLQPLLTHAQTLLPPRRPTSPARPDVRLRRQGVSPPCPHHPSHVPRPRIADRLPPPPSPRWSSAERTTRSSMSSKSSPSPASSHTQCLQRTGLLLLSCDRGFMVSRR